MHILSRCLCWWALALGFLAANDLVLLGQGQFGRREHDFAQVVLNDGSTTSFTLQNPSETAYRRKLVHISNQNRGSMSRNGPLQVMAQHQVDHAGLVDDADVPFQRLVLVVIESARGRIEFQQAMSVGILLTSATAYLIEEELMLWARASVCSSV